VLATFAAGKDRDSGRTIAALDDLVPVLSLARSAMKLKKGQAMNERQRAKIDERRRLLEFERRMLMKKTESNVKGFEEALEQVGRCPVVFDAVACFFPSLLTAAPSPSRGSSAWIGTRSLPTSSWPS
jgi:hypothetical protein